jgi:hypothetical protein
MKYYFLVSFLPDIHRDDKKLKLRLADLLAEKYLFTGKDWAEIEWILLAGDVLQIERLWAGKEVEVEYSLYGMDFWKEQIRSPKDIPDFFEDALNTFVMDGPSPKAVEQLYEAYFTHAIERSASRFLRSYLAFEKDLRNIITAIRARKKGLPPFDHVLGEGDLVDFLGRSTAEDFGLLAEYPWIEELMASWEPLQTEDTIQKILWGTIDEMAAPMRFEFDVVLAYLLKLHILEQNLALSDEGGKEIIRQLEEL